MQSKRPLILLFPTLFLLSCQHARVEFAPALISPEERRSVLPDDPSMKRAKDRVVVHQNFYVFGLLPRSKSYEEHMLCPSKGIREIHQFTSISDAVLAQMTLGIYAPRTLEIHCY